MSGENHPLADEFGPVQAEVSPPVDVFVTVAVGGDRVTEFSVAGGETVTVHSRVDEGEA